MQESLKQSYGEEYFRQANFEFATRYPFFHIIAGTLIEKFEPKSILDIGCAKGHFVYAFRELGVEAYGVDISEYAISQSPEIVRAALFSNVDVDFQKLPFQDEAFDMVTAMALMEHLQNHNHLIREMKRVLQPGGIVFIRTPKIHLEILLGMVGIREPTHINAHSKSFWIRTFESHDFRYIGDLPRDAHKRALHAQYAEKEAIKKAIGSRQPDSNMARFLLRFGRVGKWFRQELASILILLPSEALMFRL